MKIIGKAKVQNDSDYQRGVLVDVDGFFVARVQWSNKRPVINKKGTPKDQRRRLITLDKNPNAANVPSDTARWDFAAQDWIAPPNEMTLIREDTGQIIKRFKGFRDRLPECPEGCAIVDGAPPKAKGRKPLYDKASQSFVAPRRVALVDPDGVVQNIVLENPNDTAPDVEVPDGWSRVDDRDGTLPDIGSKRRGKEWVAPDAAKPEKQNTGGL